VQDLTIAVVGATGAVGAEFLRIVETRYPTLPKLKLLASRRSAGKRISVGGNDFAVEEATEKSFDGVDVAFISASSEVSHRLAPAAVAAGAVVIDDGSAFRMEETVPLVVPEVNGSDVDWHQGIISIPNCSTTPLVMAAHPLHQMNPIKRIVADTYQSVSGAGGGAMADLREQSERLLNADSNTSKSGDGQIAYNVVPQIDRFLETGYTFEEQKMRQESQKILHAPEIQISATCVRVPVYISHSPRCTLNSPGRCRWLKLGNCWRPCPALQCWTIPSRANIPCPGTWPARMTCSWGASGRTCRTPTGWCSG